MKKIILASQSPRRIEMMEWLKIPFECVNPNIDESKLRSKDPVKLTKMLAQAKAEAVSDINKLAIVIGSDAVVSFENMILEKPADINEQRKMLKMQRNKPATVVCAVCVLDKSRDIKICKVKKTKYIMANVTDAQIELYIKTGDGLSRAGGYGQQDENGLFIATEFDCYPNSIGFPICLVQEILESIGIEVEGSVIDTVKEKTGRRC